MFTFDRFTFELANIRQYYLDMERANGSPETEWRQLYQFRELYGLQNITAQSLHQLSEDFKKFASEGFHIYYDMNRVDYTDVDVNYPCSHSCKFEHICAMQNVDRDGFEVCVAFYSGGNANSSSIYRAFVLMLIVGVSKVLLL